MSLFDTALSTDSQTLVTLSPAEAFAAIILAATAIENHLTEDEAYCISSRLLRMQLFKSYSHELMNKLFDKILSILRRDGMNTLFNTAKESLSQDLREAAFAVAADMVLIDGVSDEEEKNFLNDLHQALGIPREIALQIVQVISIKNLG